MNGQVWTEIAEGSIGKIRLIYEAVRPHEVWMVIKKDLLVLKPQLTAVKEYFQKQKLL